MKNLYEETNPLLNPDTFIQVRLPLVEDLGNLITKAKGKNRTMADFAKQCGVSGATFSRIVNGKITQPIPFETLVSIWRNAVPNAKITIPELVLANGMDAKDRSLAVDPHEKQRQTAEKMKSIIMEELLSRNLVVSQHLVLKDVNVPELVAASGNSAMILELKDESPKYWRIQMMVNSGIQRDPRKQSMEVDHEAEAYVMFHHEAEIFLKDAWEPESLKEIKISYAFDDEYTCRAFTEYIKDAQVNGCFSVVLLDTTTNRVLHEYIIPKKIGEVTKSVFSLPKVILDTYYQDLRYLDTCRI